MSDAASGSGEHQEQASEVPTGVGTGGRSGKALWPPQLCFYPESHGGPQEDWDPPPALGPTVHLASSLLMLKYIQILYDFTSKYFV